MAKVFTYRKLVKKLKAHDDRFTIYTNRGKGSERIIYHPDIKGRAESYPIKCHGEGAEIRKGHLSAIVRRFNLPSKFFK